jgi:conjugal transfer pilus assembly protein TraW
MHKIYFINAIIIFACILSWPAKAIDLGVFGETYPIKEQDLLQFIEQRLLQWQQSGQLFLMQKNLLAQVEKHIDRPTILKNSPRATQNKQWLFDPSIRIATPLSDFSGNIFAKAGQSLNPLDWVSLHETLVFYDADDEAQVKWAQKFHANQTIKLILVKGSISSQLRIFDKPIYFDQGNKLTQHFGIEHVPAVIAQKGKQLQITEVRL